MSDRLSVRCRSFVDISVARLGLLLLAVPKRWKKDRQRNWDSFGEMAAARAALSPPISLSFENSLSASILLVELVCRSVHSGGRGGGVIHPTKLDERESRTFYSAAALRRVVIVCLLWGRRHLCTNRN